MPGLAGGPQAQQPGQLLPLGEHGHVVVGHHPERHHAQDVHPHRQKDGRDHRQLGGQKQRQAEVRPIGHPAHHQGGARHRQGHSQKAGHLGHQAPDGPQVQHHDEQVRAHGAHRAAHGVDLRHPDEHKGQGDLHHAPGGHVQHRQNGLAEGLEDGVGGKQGAVQEDGQAQHGQQGGRLGGGVRLVGQQQLADGIGKNAHAHAGGDGNQQGQSHGDGGDVVHGALVLGGHRPGEHRQQAGGDGHHERPGQVEELSGVAQHALHGLGGVQGEARPVLQPVHEDGGVHKVQQTQKARAQRDGHGEADQVHQKLPTGGGGQVLPGPLPLVQPVLPQLVAHQVQSPQPGADGHPGDGPHSRPGVVVIPADDKGGQAHADDHLGGGLDNLGDGGGHHVAPALEVPPQGGHNGDEEHGGGQGHHGLVRPGVAGEPGDGRRPEEHGQAPQQPDGEKQPEGHGEHPVRLFLPALGVGRAHHAGHRHRQPGGGQHQKHPEDVVGRVEVGHGPVVDDVGQG